VFEPRRAGSCAAADNKRTAIGQSSQSLFIKFLPPTNEPNRETSTELGSADVTSMTGGCSVPERRGISIEVPQPRIESLKNPLVDTSIL